MRIVKLGRVGIGGILIASSLFAGAGAAWSAGPASSKILPDQQFVGLINGTTHDATIRMACFGPVFPGEQGHPMDNQPVEVLKAEVIMPFGFTGDKGTSIVATFPGTGTTPQVIPFDYYGVKKNIPTSFLLPCSGSGTVVFNPEPTSPNAVPFKVTVNFVGQP